MPRPLHVVTLSFDDGFKNSSIRTAEVFEQAGLQASLNVLAAPEVFARDQKIDIPFGDFDLWNQLKSRGHEVMPHGYRHANKRSLPLSEAQSLIGKCLDIFDRELAGFDRRSAIFNYPYNATTPELESWLATQVRASRGGWIAHGINPFPTRQTTVIRTHGFGPGDCGEDLDRCVAELLKRDAGGWLVYNPHGLDGEGWGPMEARLLADLLARLKRIPTVQVWTAERTLREFGALD